MEHAPGLDIVVPVYNEEENVEELIARLRRSCPGACLFVVDNASTDRTAALLERMPDVTLIRHERNLGYGRSLADGIVAGSGERIVMIDGDLEYLPEDVPAVDRALGSAHAVYGSRFLGPGAAVGVRSRFWTLGNWLVTHSFNVLFRQHLTDLYTGIRGVRRTALAAAALRSPGFEAVLEMAVAMVHSGFRIAEVPVGYAPRQRGQSKMRHVREFCKFGYHLLRLRLRGAPGGLKAGRCPAGGDG